MIPDPAPRAFDPDPAPPQAAADARALIERQMAVLSRLTEIGMAVAEACGRRAVAEAAGEHSAGAADPGPDAGLVFARVARAVRLTIALQQRLMKDLDALDKAQAHAERMRTVGRRLHLRDLVGEAARTLVEARRKAEGRLAGDEDAAEAEIELMTETAYERLTDAEDDDLDALSFDEAVASVCRDLGLAPDRAARLMATVEPPLGRHAPAAPGLGQRPTRGQAPRSGGRWRGAVRFRHPPLDHPDKPGEDPVGEEPRPPP